MLKTIPRSVPSLILGLSFGIPFFNVGDYRIDALGKNIYFLLILLLISISSGAIILRTGRSIKLDFNIMDGLFVSYYLICFLSLINNELPIFSEKFLTLSSLTVFYFLVKIMFIATSRSDFDRHLSILMAFILLSGLFQSIWGLLQLYHVLPSLNSLFGITGGFINPAPYAAYIACVLPTSLWVYLVIEPDSKANRALKHLAIITLTFCLIVLPSTQIRASWIAATGGVIFILNWRFNFLTRMYGFFKSKLRIPQMVVLTVLVCLAIAYQLYKYKPDSAYGRLFRWKVIASLISDSIPLSGYGYSSFPKVYNNAQIKWFASNSNNRKDKLVAGEQKYAYNEYIESFIELGLLGLILFIAIKIVSIRAALTISRSTGSGLYYSFYACILATLLSILILELFSYPLSSLPIQVIFVIILGIISSYIHAEKLPNRVSKTSPYAYLKLFLLFTFLIMLAICLFIQRVNYFYAYKLWIKAKFYDDLGDHLAAKRCYAQTYRVLYFNGEYLMDFGLNLFHRRELHKSLIILNKAETYYSSSDLYIAIADNYMELKLFAKAEHNYMKAAYLMPVRFVPKYKLMKLYLLRKDEEKTRLMAKEILNSSVKFNSVEIQQIQAEAARILELN